MTAPESMNTPLLAREDFPILDRKMRNGQSLVYLDSGATSQKPQVVVDAEVHVELQANGAVNRGSHELAAQATEIVEDARSAVAQFVGVRPEEIVWTKNSTESLNLLAYAFDNVTRGRGSKKSFERFAIEPHHNIVVTRAEHHANLIPWQELCIRTGAQLRWLDLDDDGRLDLATADVIDDNTRVVAFAHASNVTGAIAPVAQLVERAHAMGALVVLDACQSVPHIPVDFSELDVDFAVFSGHKMMAPTGIGVLYGKAQLLKELPPFLFGGSMVEIVTMEKTTYAKPPARFEAGTQAVAQIAGLGAAVEYLSAVGMQAVEEYEAGLTRYLLENMAEIEHVRILGPAQAEERLGVVAFEVEGVHPHDVGQILDEKGIAVRVGHHCAQPIHQHFGVWASSRVSVAPYNTRADIDAFIETLKTVRAFFGLEVEQA
ncbi:cysteine desulfurase/selenocysteine lyase [Arcanobacterium pluranimalium]|uniref:SufS family cysteine desulfurase n=1 Tax=Arcanobacterium pluranimalium TaxID=108028 RepID=UPI001EF7C20A|nr:SufS family cysteine desulfurase [Arcanobacterium pluranimalium]MBM7825338.1 cysteine desulfurase/selenocysteine lyase [Arcanobacterium pluranimalium]